MIKRVLKEIEIINLNQRKYIIALLLVGALFSIIQFLTNYFSDIPLPGLITVLKGDVVDYIALSESLIEKGVYGFDGNPSFYRMPGFAFFYLPFRMLLEKNMAINALLIFQVLFSVLAKFLFSKIVHFKTNLNSYFLITFLILIIGSPLIFRNNILYAESLAGSCLMIGLYYLFLFDTTRKGNYLFFAGVFVALMIFLRPFTGMIIPLVSLYLLLKNNKIINVLLIKQNLKFICFFLVLQIGWVNRNYTEFNRFIPLEGSMDGTYCSTSFCSWRKLVLKTGKSGEYWKKNTLGTWFISEEYLKEIDAKRPSDEIVPIILLTSHLTIDTLKRARDLSNGVYDSIFSKPVAEMEANRIFSMFDDSLRFNHPYTYYIYSRITPIYDTFFQPGSPTKSLTYPINVITVFYNTISSFLVLSIGFFIFLYLFKVKGDLFTVLMLLFNAFSILFNDIILMDHENRYILINYGILVFCIMYTLHLAKNKYFLILTCLGLSIFVGFAEILKMY